MPELKRLIFTYIIMRMTIIMKMKQEGSVICRRCMIKDKTSMTPQVSECTKLAQSEYKERHEKVAGIVNGALCH